MIELNYFILNLVVLWIAIIYLFLITPIKLLLHFFVKELSEQEKRG